MKVLFKRITITILALSTAVVISAAELSVQERIRLHKEWLENKAGLRAQLASIKYQNQLTKFKNQEDIMTKKENSIEKTKLLQKTDLNRNDVYPEFENDTNIILSNKTLENESTIQTTTDSFTTTVFPQSSSTVSSELEATTIVLGSSKNDLNFGNFTNKDIVVQIPTQIISSQEYSNSTRRVHVKKYPRWGPWSRWSDCSRSCGIGVMYQTRKCISRKPNSGKRIISKECAGLYRRYHLCNEQDCPTEDVDFRHLQCSSFDDVLFQGKLYKWEPYVKADAECELNCKPIEMKYFATLNETVIDGTHCTRPAEYYRKNYRGPAICVGGICKVSI